MTGVEAFLEILAGAGVRYIFGNPGSTELPINDALVGDDRFNYIFGLQEVPLTAMADGYAMASGTPGVVCVHICCGLGNSMGMLYNAHCEGTPLILLAGQQDRRLRFSDPVLAGDMVGVTRPWTKWSVEVERIEDLPNAVRRALQTALTPPTGPVFMSLPVDLQREQVENLDLSPPHIPDRRVRSPLDALKKTAERLLNAENPVILAGSRVTETSAIAELVALAERLGIPVLTETSATHGRLPMPADHPLYAGLLSLWSPEIRQQLEPYDLLFAVGTDLMRLYIHREPANPVPEHLRLIHLDSTPGEIGKNFPVEIGLLGDPQAGLSELSQIIDETITPERRRKAAENLDTHAAHRTAERDRFQAELDDQRARHPMTLPTFAEAICRVLPPDVAVIEESMTTHLNLLEKLGHPRDPYGYFAHRGWALGWGLGCAIGLKVAWPDRPVLSIIGDGSALYGIQGLWTAAHHRIPVTFVISNNTQYGILKMGGRVMNLPHMSQNRYLGMDLTDPTIDFIALARSFGVEAHRLSEPDELSARLEESFKGDTPLLLDVAIEK